MSFLPAISTKAAKAIRKTIRDWRMASTRNNQRLEDLARLVNPVVRGWMNYYGRFYRVAVRPSPSPSQRGPCCMGATEIQAVPAPRACVVHWLGRVARREPYLFVHWQLGARPAAGV